MRKPIELEEIRANEFMDIIGADFQKRISSKGGVFKLWYIGGGLALIEREGHRDQVLVLGPSVILIPKADTTAAEWMGAKPEASKPEPAPLVIEEAPPKAEPRKLSNYTPPKPKTGPKTRPRAKHKSK